jgi:hypothetical protein
MDRLNEGAHAEGPQIELGPIQLVSTGYHRLFRLMERSGPATNVRAATGAAQPASGPDAAHAENSSNSRALEPVFVGGAGRSGTTILARLIGEHSRYYTIPFEIRFHTGPIGLTDLLADRVPMKKFITRLRSYWWRRPNRKGGMVGLHRITSEEAFEAAVSEFQKGWKRDRLEASQTLMRSLVHPFLEEVGTPGWVEHTPPNVKAAPALASMYRDMKLIHIVRDGRDVASSAVRFTWGPDSMSDGIIWWANTLREADQGAKELRPGQSTVFQLEDFVVRRREESYERLLQFLGIEDEPGMRSFFETQMNADKAHIGRWRLGLPEAEQKEIMDLYVDVLEGLHRDGIAGAPSLPVDAPQ